MASCCTLSHIFTTFTARHRIFNLKARPSLFLHLTLRFLHLATITLTGYTFCYLIWMHNNHYCAWYPDKCTYWQREQTRVPRIYITLVTTFTFAFLCTFVLSFRHIASFLDTVENSCSLSNYTDEREGQHTDESFPIVKFTKRTLRSIAKTALLADLAVLVVLIWSQLGLSVTGPTYCRLFRPIGRNRDDYWKNAKVADKDCTVAVNGYVANFFVIGFTVLLVILDGLYLFQSWWETKCMGEGAIKLSDEAVIATPEVTPADVKTHEDDSV